MDQSNGTASVVDELLHVKQPLAKFRWWTILQFLLFLGTMFFILYTPNKDNNAVDQKFIFKMDGNDLPLPKLGTAK